MEFDLSLFRKKTLVTPSFQNLLRAGSAVIVWQCRRSSSAVLCLKEQPSQGLVARIPHWDSTGIRYMARICGSVGPYKVLLNRSLRHPLGTLLRVAQLPHGSGCSYEDEAAHSARPRLNLTAAYNMAPEEAVVLVLCDNTPGQYPWATNNPK